MLTLFPYENRIRDPILFPSSVTAGLEAADGIRLPLGSEQQPKWFYGGNLIPDG